MTEALLLQVFAYVLLLALVSLALIYAPFKTWLKLGLVLLTTGCYLLAYQAWQQTQGWPSHTTLPDKFLLHASVIDEPDVEAGTKGKIFIWASTLKGSFPVSEPRAYLIPYGKQAHSALEDALKNMREGNLQMGGLSKGSQKGNKPPQNLDGIGEEQLELKFEKLPDPSLPEK
ncbi:MAG: hypothetical protein WAQ53_10405 [Thiofilum sp.]|uniref:hypothetical protein n=1 Tax=Thiofilum sp. TaxID=2212733 RepID=UPI0025DEEB58|nr:hypothetical protein [Thiofilum sp.]MBK8453273.1 hypothetical protein [Thiofilum sp.]